MYEKQSRNTNRSTDTIASFLLKTYQILQHPQYQRIISWDKSGVGFIIHDVVLFTREILPKYFRHSNFSSFVRQLNMYDFHKVKQQNEVLVFKNPLFCKGQQQNLKFIRRKAAKKITGQKRAHISQKNDIENEKYQTLLKGFKKSFQAQINQSSFFYEKSLQIIKDLNDSNLRKKLYIKDIFGEQQKIQTTQQIKNMPLETKIEQGEGSKPKKDTIIQIPKQFLQSSSEIQQHKESSKIQSIQKKQMKELNIDNLMLLKQEVYKSLGNYQIWLQEYIETQKKKVKYINGYRQQLIKCRETKTNENNENQQQEEKQEIERSDSKQDQDLENYEASMQDRINENQIRKNQNQNESENQEGNEKQLQIAQKQNKDMLFKNTELKKQLIQQQNQKSVQNLKNQQFSSLIHGQSQLGTRLFSAFSKSKNFEDRNQQGIEQFQNNLINNKIQKITHNLREKEGNQIEGSF